MSLIKLHIRICLISALLLLGHFMNSQTGTMPTVSTKSVFKNLNTGDSLIFYQCHVESGIQQLSTASGQTITGKEQKFTITDKYVLIKEEAGYIMRYYNSSLHVFPNKKFTGLKFKERSYWEFTLVKSVLISAEQTKIFMALEEKGRDALVYDYPVTKYTTNQLIIRYNNDYKQLVIEGAYVLSKLLALQTN